MNDLAGSSKVRVHVYIYWITIVSFSSREY
jgi:hypothetical protein